MSGGRWLDGAADPARRAVRAALDDRAPDDSALARQRVWSRVQAPWTPRPKRRLAPWLLLATAGAVAAVLAGTILLRPPAPIARTTPRPRPSVQVEPLPPTLPPVALTTGPGERAMHRLARGVEVELSPASALLTGDAEVPPEVRGGRVRFSVPHQEPGRPYRVRAGAYQVVVVGTSFVVGVESRAVSVAVDSGVVEVEEVASGRRLERLSPGQRWSSEGSPAHRAAHPALPTEAAPGLLERAREARRRGDGAQALALYQRMAEAGGPLAETSLYEIGSIHEQDLHQPREALAAWERYRARYPRGQFRAEADVSLIAVLAELGEPRRALDEALRFLAAYPRSENRAKVARLAADLERTRGDCQAAVPHYELAAQGRPGQDTDDALFYRAVCLQQLRDPGAAEAARQYRTRFPAGRHATEAERLLAPTTSGGPAR